MIAHPAELRSTAATQMNRTRTMKDVLDHDYQRTPDRKIIRGGRTKGERTGMSVMESWYNLFELNELQPKARKLTNAELCRQMAAEYPSRPAIQKLLDKESKANFFRYLFNTGQLLSYRPGCPEKISFRYDVDGNRVTTTSGRIMSADEIRAYIEKYRNWKPKPRTKIYSPRHSSKRKGRRSKSSTSSSASLRKTSPASSD